MRLATFVEVARWVDEARAAVSESQLQGSEKLDLFLRRLLAVMTAATRVPATLPTQVAELFDSALKDDAGLNKVQ